MSNVKIRGVMVRGSWYYQCVPDDEPTEETNSLLFASGDKFLYASGDDFLLGAD